MHKIRLVAIELSLVLSATVLKIRLHVCCGTHHVYLPHGIHLIVEIICLNSQSLPRYSQSHNKTCYQDSMRLILIFQMMLDCFWHASTNSNSSLPGAGHSEGEGRQIISEVAPRLVKP